MGTRCGAVKYKGKGEREAWLEKIQFLSDAMESTSQPFAAGGPDGSTMIFNEAFCRLTGYTREELYHLSWARDLTAPESLPDERKMLAVLDRTREPQRYEKYYRRKDGTVIPVELLMHAALDAQGSILFYYSFITDISDRKRKDDELIKSHERLEIAVRQKTAELSRSEERLRRMIEASPVPMVMFEGDRINFVNKKFVETFGYTIEDIPTLDHWWPLAYPDENYRKFVVKRWDAAIGPAIMARTSTEPREVIVTCKDGSKKQILSYFSSIGDLNLSVFYDITERTLIEEKLAHVASFPELNPAPILEIDDDGKITYKNPAADRIFPDLAARGANHPVTKGIEFPPHPFSRTECRQIDRDLEINGIHYQQSILRMPESRKTRIYFTDITKRKLVEEALQDSEVRFRSLIQNSSDIIRILDRDGRIVYDSPSSEKILGYPPGYTLGKSPLEFIHPDDRAHIMKDLGLVYDARNSGVPSEFRIRKADGEYLDCESVGMNLIGIPGVDGIVVTTRPITERKRAEETLRASEEIARQRAEELEKLMDVVPAAIWVSQDPECRVIVGNQAGNRFYEAESSENVSAGRAPGGEQDQTRRFFRDGQELKPEELPMQESAAKDVEVKNSELDVLLPSGRNMTMLGSAIPLHDAAGNVRGSVGAFVDITRRRQMERDLSEAKAQAELYLDLMGHDISNMHQIILMQLELALSVLDEEGRLEQRDREMLTTSVKTLDRSVNLISNVRMLQKVRSGEYRAEPLDLGHVLDDVVKIYADIPGRDITIKYAPSGGCMVMASPLIKDVLGNLVDNAVKHSKDPVEIGLGVSEASYKGASYYRVSVEDNGIGIPDEKKDLIFQRFKRGHTTAKGTGLGLYIVRTLVEGFGGYVEVEDRIKGDHTKGARFIVYLPVAAVKNNE